MFRLCVQQRERANVAYFLRRSTESVGCCNRYRTRYSHAGRSGLSRLEESAPARSAALAQRGCARVNVCRFRPLAAPNDTLDFLVRKPSVSKRELEGGRDVSSWFLCISGFTACFRFEECSPAADGWRVVPLDAILRGIHVYVGCLGQVLLAKNLDDAQTPLTAAHHCAFGGEQTPQTCAMACSQQLEKSIIPLRRG
jgi:hypothetical protein